MQHPPATRPASAIESLYETVQQNLDPAAGDVALDRLMQLFRRLSDLYDTDVSSPLNMGYFCIDADAASLTAMDETNRRGANIAVEDSTMIWLRVNAAISLAMSASRITDSELSTFSWAMRK